MCVCVCVCVCVQIINKNKYIHKNKIKVNKFKKHQNLLRSSIMSVRKVREINIIL